MSSADASSKMPAIVASLARILRALVRSRRAITSERLAKVPHRRACDPVSPCTILMRLRRRAELIGDDLRERGAQALSVRGKRRSRLDEADGSMVISTVSQRASPHAARGERLRAIAGALAECGDAETEIAAFRARLQLASTKRRHATALTAASMVSM